MDLLDNDKLGQSFSIDSGIEYARKLVCDDDPTHFPVSFLEASEQRAQAIALFAASVVVRRWQWIKENDCVPWFREQLLIAAKRLEPPSNTDERISRYPVGYRRSAARALCILLQENPKDKEIRKAILNLSLHVNNEVRVFLFNGLKVLWLTDQKLIWKCIDDSVKNSKSKNTQKSIRNCLATEVDTDSLMSVLCCLPTDNNINRIANVSRLVDFLEELLLFTLKAYTFYQKDDHYNAWDHNEWNHFLFQIIANFILRLPPKNAEAKFYDHIMKTWEKTPSMMETFLRSLLVVGCQPELEDRLAELWPQIGQSILSSQEQNNIKCYHGETKNILGLLIFADPKGIITWKVNEWKPLKKLVPFINKWCDTVGHDSNHFPSLVRFLKTIGFSLFPEFGISWLYNCIGKMSNKEETLYKNSFALSELLCTAWSKNENLIEQNSDNMRRFVFIVDTMARQGDASGLRLQAKLQAN